MHVCDIWIHIQQRSHVPTALKSEITRMDLKAEREKEFYLYIEKKRRMKNKCCENTRIYIIVCVYMYIYIYIYIYEHAINLFALGRTFVRTLL